MDLSLRPAAFQDTVFIHWQVCVSEYPWGQETHGHLFFLAFGPDLLASSVVDMPHSFRLKGSNAEDFTPPSRSLAAHPRPCLGGESRASGPYLGKALPGLAQMKLRREGIWEGVGGWSRAQKALGGWSFRQDGGKAQLRNIQQQTGSKREQLEIWKETSFFKKE